MLMILLPHSNLESKSMIKSKRQGVSPKSMAVVLAGGAGMALGDWLVQAIFSSSAEAHYALLIVAPLLGLLTALAASALPVWHTVRQNTAEVLHGN
jgi:hypothetical protein